MPAWKSDNYTRFEIMNYLSGDVCASCWNFIGETAYAAEDNISFKLHLAALSSRKTNA